jgi:hypothetical protein
MESFVDVPSNQESGVVFRGSTAAAESAAVLGEGNIL